MNTGGHWAVIVCSLPDVVAFAVRLFVPDEARAGLVERLLAVFTAQASHVPLEVGRHTQDVLVEDLISTSDTHGRRTPTPHRCLTPLPVQ